MVIIVANSPLGSFLASSGTAIGVGAARFGMRGALGATVRVFAVAVRGARFVGREGLARPDSPSL